MTIENPTTEGIDVVAVSSAGPGHWRIRFASIHDGACHQVYLDGCLTGWTEQPSVRDLLVDAARTPRSVRLLACPPALRRRDHAAQLPPAEAPTWQWSARVIRQPQFEQGDRLQVVDAAGAVLAEIQACAADSVAWTFGRDALGAGGFGWDGSFAPGAGLGSFGASFFGFDAHCVRLAVPYLSEGRRELAVRLRRPDGSIWQQAPSAILAAPPPRPPASIGFASYDVSTGTVHLSIEE